MSSFVRVTGPVLTSVRCKNSHISPSTLCFAVIQTLKKTFFVSSEIFFHPIWLKKRVNYDKLEIATKQYKSNIKPKCILFLFWQ